MLRYLNTRWLCAALYVGSIGTNPIYAATKTEAPKIENSIEERMAWSPKLLIARSLKEASLKTGVMKRLYKIDGAGRWDVDLDAGIITFTNDGIVAKAPVQVIGTYNTLDGTWLWGWDHPSVPAHAAVAAKQLFDYGKRHKIDKITTRKITCSEEEAWELTSMASTLSGAQGLYRGSADTAYVYMTFGTVTLSKEM